MALLMDHVGQGEALSRSPSLRAAPSPVVDSSTTHLQVLAITLSRLERLSSEIVGVADRTIPPHSPVDKPVAEDDMPGPSTVLAPERDSPYCGPEDTSELEQPSSCPLTPSHAAPQLVCTHSHHRTCIYSHPPTREALCRFGNRPPGKQPTTLHL